MGRYYRLSQSITVEMASEILREAKEVENVQEAEFLEDRSKILVVTDGEGELSGSNDKACQYFQPGRPWVRDFFRRLCIRSGSVCNSLWNPGYHQWTCVHGRRLRRCGQGESY